MDKYTFEMIPGLIGEIGELLRSIDTKLDKLTGEPEPASAFPEWLNVNDLTAFMPTHPAAPTIYGWVRENLIPYYKRGKHLFFKRSEIETWMSDTRNKTDEEIERDAMEYCAKHTIGGGRRR